MPAELRHLLIPILAVCACHGGPPSANPDAGGDNGGGPDAGVVFGLDSRPSNAGCLAPQRPPAAIALAPALGGATFTWPVLVLQAPGDASRFFVVEKAGVVKSL